MPTSAPPPSKELLVQAAYDALQRASDAGIPKAIVGMSPDAILTLLEGKMMQSPLVELWFELELEGGEIVAVSVPAFCDPGLSGHTLYAIQWPEVPQFKPGFNSEGKGKQ